MNPPQIAAEVAAHIRENGHYQSKPNQHLAGYHTAGLYCVAINPTTRRLGMDDYQAYYRAVAANAGIDGHRVQLVAWNDETPTETVLAVLDEIATE